MVQKHARPRGPSRIGIMVTGLVVIALIAPVTAATAKDSDGTGTLLPTAGLVIDSGFQLISRTNGIPYGGQDENRAFSSCTVEEELPGG